MLKPQLKDKHVESIFAARLDEGSIPSSSTKNEDRQKNSLAVFF
jgi:hypothetical protein